MRRRWGVNAVIALAVIASAWAATASDVSRYDIRVTLDPAEQTIVGSEQVDYVNDTGRAIDEILFLLYGNAGAEPNPDLHPAHLDAQYVGGFDPTWTRIRGVADADGRAMEYDLEPLPPALQTFSLDDGILVVALPEPLAPDERVTVSIEFETRFAEAITLDNCVYRNSYVWRFGWNPVAVPPSVRDGGFLLPAAAYGATLTVPEEYRVFAGVGRQTKLGTVAGLTTYELTNEHPVRSIPLAIGRDFDAVTASWEGIDLEAAYLPGGETFARLALSYLAEILAYHSEQFGPLGYRRVVVVEAPGPGFYGMAADGMILVGRSLVQLKDMPVLGMHDRLAEYLLAHEAAHLWWGIGVGTDFDAENWISEGFAEYLSITYFEEKHGGFEPNLFSHLGPGLVEDLVGSELGYLNLRQHLSEAPYLDLLRLGFDEPIVRPVAELEYLNGQTVRTYNKGYLVLRALESLVGRDVLRDTLVRANEEWRGRILDVESFRALTEEIAGVDLAAFFADWLYGSETFDVAVDRFETIAADDGYTTTVHLRRTGAVLPVEVRATLADGSAVSRLWHAGTSSGSIVLDTTGPVVRVHADPDEMLPDANRFDNHWPRRILVDHPFRGEEARDIGRPLDAYVISLSPTAVSGSFRNDHQWSLIAMPHLGEDALDADIADVFGTIDIACIFAANVDRSLSVSAAATVTGLDISDGTGDLDARATLHTRHFSNPETGSAGTYWYPTQWLDLTFGARGDLPVATPYVELALGRSDAISLLMENAVTARAAIPGFGPGPFATIEWSGFKRFRLAPHVYLDISASAGAPLYGRATTEFQFWMDRLEAFALPPYGDHQLFGRVDLALPPLVRNLGYPVLNLTRIEDVAASAYVQGGRTWGSCTLVCESGIRVEAGAMITFVVDGVLGGDLAISLGYAVPLLGLDGESSVFFEVSLPR